MKNDFVKGLIMTLVAFVAAYLSDNIEIGVNWLYILISTVGISLTYVGKNAIFKSDSVFLGINLKDLYSGLILAVGTAVSSVVGYILTTGSVDWKALGIAVITAIGGYLSKTFFSNSSGQAFKK